MPMLPSAALRAASLLRLLVPACLFRGDRGGIRLELPPQLPRLVEGVEVDEAGNVLCERVDTERGRREADGATSRVVVGGL